MDTVNKKTRSCIMSRVRQRNTGPEVRLRKALYRGGVRYRLHDRSLPGSPDIILQKYHAIIFVHGCFWHSHGCRFATKPKSRRKFWLAKFRANKKRDCRNIKALLDNKWRVAIVWECDINRKDNCFKRVVEQVLYWIKSNSSYIEFPKRERRTNISWDPGTRY